MQVNANGLKIEVEDSGGAGRPAVLLIMGLGMQLIGWPPDFVQALVDAGFRVIRLDNRDAGLSQGFDDAGVRNLIWESMRQRIGLPVRAVYSLQDMANDALGVLDALKIERAHVIGASMGGMIAQRLAACAPARVERLVSIMSSSGARRLPGPRPEVAAALLKRPANGTEEALLAHSLRLVKLIQSPAYPQSDAALTQRLAAALRRAYRPAGTMRQILAIASDVGRERVLASIVSPTLVLHGDADPLVPIACGRDTAARIRGARFVPIPGMAHDLPPGVVAALMKEILPFLQDVHAAGSHQ